jgi:2,4-dienoyl-CoA reductase-like NADH-dependent reductase (Old Yellow Enzyme family)
MSHLFSPANLGSLTLDNRIVVAPMCQYSAIDGSFTDWHFMHLGQFAVGGAGLVFVEASGVEPQGRITPGCPGLYSDENEAAMARVIRFFRDYGAAKIGIQLAHAGRKASADLPWNGGAALAGDNGAWETSSASALPYAEGWHTPMALDQSGMERIIQAFVQAARRAVRLGYDVVEVHAAHGYLLHQFLSPLSNQRDDFYGGSLENRMRFPLEVFQAVRDVVADIPLGVRFSATDWVDDSSWSLSEATEFSSALKKIGCDFIDVSSGGNSPLQKIKVGAGYQVGFADHIRRETGLTTMAVGMITDPKQAETIVATGQADFVALARGMLYDPRWAWHAAEVLRAKASFPPQYMRSHPTLLGEPIPGNPPKR